MHRSAFHESHNLSVISRSAFLGTIEICIYRTRIGSGAPRRIGRCARLFYTTTRGGGAPRGVCRRFFYPARGHFDNVFLPPPVGTGEVYSRTSPEWRTFADVCWNSERKKKAIETHFYRESQTHNSSYFRNVERRVIVATKPLPKAVTANVHHL